MSEREWLESLKAGDVVVLDGYGQSLARIERTTATMIVVGDSKYQRRTGRRISDDRWHSTYLREATPERRLKIKRESKVEMLKRTYWHALPDEVLFEVADRVEQAVELAKAK